MMTNLSLRQRLYLAFGTATLGAALLVGVGYWSLSRLQQSIKWNVHTYQVLDASQAALLNMVNIETGMRGFAVSGKEAFLEPYQQGETNFGRHLTEIRRLTSDNPAQQQRIAKLEQQHDEFKNIAEQVIAQRRAVDAGAVRNEDFIQQFSVGRDKAAMDGFRAGIAEFMGVERVLLSQRSAEADSAGGMASALMVYGGLGLVAAIATIAALVIRHIIGIMGGEPAYARDVMRRIAGGDMSQPVNVLPGAGNSLLASVREMQDSLS